MVLCFKSPYALIICARNSYFILTWPGVKNLSVIKSMSDRGVGFFETYFQISDNDPEEIKIAIDKFSEIVGSYILEDL